MTDKQRPLWRYQDDIGRTHIGHLENTMDDGKTYAFRDKNTKELSVVSGPLLKEKAHRIWFRPDVFDIHENDK